MSVLVTPAATVAAPGSLLGVRVEWALSAPAQWVGVTLAWETAGRGTVDKKVVRQWQFAGAPAVGAEEFAIQLPQSPYSFSGKLVTVKWRLYGEAADGTQGPATDITLSPTDGEIDLRAYDPPSADQT